MRLRWIGIATAPLLLAACAPLPQRPGALAPAEATVVRPAAPLLTAAQTIEFEDGTVGQPPSGWVAATTNGGGAAGRWEIMQGSDVPSRTKVVGLVDPGHANTDTYNLLVSETIGFQNGRIQVDVLPRAGQIDQGGGLAWRVQDENNYYICRWNPLERNFRLYVVENGERRQLASADVSFPAREWHRIVVEQDGDSIRCVLGDNVARLGAIDSTITSGGAIALCTKADALTAFDGLIVTPAPATRE